MHETQVESCDYQLSKVSSAGQISGFHQNEGSEDSRVLISKDQQWCCPVAKHVFAKKLELVSMVVPLLSSWDGRSLEAFGDHFPVPVATQAISKMHKVGLDDAHFESEFRL